MLCAIYKSHKKVGCYLYLPAKAKFDQLPETLLNHFGKPELVMLFNLAGNKSLAQADNQQVQQQIEQQGYYLQLAKPEENLFETYQRQQQVSK
ncbi:YcgL domain-containing protein [Volucribacter amazonae]|uniref:YcgL domain-containing protein A6A20_00115 n=1 Tax=Volucribacter amazonae TaxID=256731 RepID=A0A9X4PLP4_9PAST|nr:YcgL domain-containing protein [Volucribacter amazonae]MDG6894068.1 hypothetical protein [Volucribacter amazonae]